MPVIVLLGAPGAGKGTQAPILSACLGVPILASGELLRGEVASGTEMGREVDAIMRSGDLVPDSTMAQLFLGRLSRPDAAGGALLDGYPRTRPQAEALDHALEESARRVDRAVLIEVPIEELVGRFAGRLVCRAGGHVYNERTNPPRTVGVCDIDGSELAHRADDDEATVRARMEQQLGPLGEVAEHYRAGGILTAIDGTFSIGAVAAALLSVVRTPAAAS